LLKENIYLISNLDVIRVKEFNSFANNIKEARKEIRNIFIIKSYQVMILYVKLNIKM